MFFACFRFWRFLLVFPLHDLVLHHMCIFFLQTCVGRCSCHTYIFVYFKNVLYILCETGNWYHSYYYSVTSRSDVNSCHCLCSNKMTALNSSTLTKQLATLIIGLGVAPTVCVWLSVRTRLPQCVEVLYICEQVRGSDGPPRWRCEWCQLSLLNHWQLLSPWWLLLSPALNVYLLPFTLEQ